MEKKKTHNIRISQDRNISLYLGNPQHRDRILKIGKALPFRQGWKSWTS